MPAKRDTPFDFTPIATDARIRVGIGGWNFAPWRKHFYPDGLPQRRELEYASRRLNAIEINSTFYGAQKPATYARWAAETPEGFVFSLKAPRYLVQTHQLAQTGKAVRGFLEGGIGELGDRLGPIVWQLAPWRAFDIDDLEPFLAALPRTLNGQPLRHVLEVRHPSFLAQAYVELARRQNITTVFTDSPDYPSLADLTGPLVYARLMRSEPAQTEGYRAAALDDWAARARRWADGQDNPELPHVLPTQPAAKPREVFVFFIGAAKPRNPAAAQALLARLAD
ncbi:MAG: DUF72 domain-containing protein [Dyella sp.]